MVNPILKDNTQLFLLTMGIIFLCLTSLFYIGFYLPLKSEIEVSKTHLLLLQTQFSDLQQEYDEVNEQYLLLTRQYLALNQNYVIVNSQHEVFFGDITIDQAQRLIDISSFDLLIVDVRSREAFLEGHLVDAVNIPYELLMLHLEEYIISFQDLHTDILMYCQCGITSSLAMEQLNIQGIVNVYNLLGGFTAWRDRDYPIDQGGCNQCGG